jgi:hypothetical protein
VEPAIASPTMTPVPNAAPVSADKTRTMTTSKLAAEASVPAERVADSRDLDVSSHTGFLLLLTVQFEILASHHRVKIPRHGRSGCELDSVHIAVNLGEHRPPGSVSSTFTVYTRTLSPSDVK